MKPLEIDPEKMQRIWAPWRMEYVSRDEGQPASPSPQAGTALPPGADPSCFLCQAAADTADRVQRVVFRRPRSLTLLNRYPYNNGHLLIAPCQHKAGLDDLADDEHLELIQTMTRVTGTLQQLMQPDGFNIGLNLGRVAGAGVPGHLHWHVVPRWNGDANFMPVVGSTRVMPQSLDALWDVLTAALEPTP